MAGASLTVICREFEKAGVLTAAGKPSWEYTVMRRVLVGWRTAGVRIYKRKELRDEHGELMMGVWKPIISLAEREQALAMLKKRSITKVRQGSWVLWGLVRCGECGHKMYGQLGYATRPNTYCCSKGGGHVSTLAEKLEDYVMSKLASRLLGKLETGEAAVQPAKPDQWSGEDRLAVVQQKTDELLSAYRENKLSAAIVFPQVEALTAEKDALSRERETYYATEAKPEPAFKRTSDLLDWAQKLAVGSPYRHPETKALPKWENQPWGDGSSSEREPEDIDTLAEEKVLTLRSELKEVIIKKGTRGQAGKDWNVFRKRIDLVWND
ncbi:zinc ribbon domain-containing protein [Pseudoclavibacter sp. 13-3]|nr:zinc ribbon domain-containing protein [Pseudoclavibacter sp. 13-3]